MMPKITFEFAAEEIEAAEDAFRGTQFKSALQAIERHIRSRIKHADLDEPVRTELELVHSVYYQEVEGLGLE